MRAQAGAAGDEPRAALIDDAKFAFDIRADLARRARQDFSDPGLQRLFLHLRQARGAAAAVKARQTFEPVLQEQRMPAPDGVVVEKKRRGDPLATPTVVKQDQGIRAPRKAMRRRTVSRQGDQVGAILRRKIASANHASKTSP